MEATGANTEEKILLTRSGYNPHEIRKTLEKTMIQNGALATGKALHYTADIVLSGGVDIVMQLLWEYALFHIGIASPRIFVYLKSRVREVCNLLKRLPDEQAYATEEFQVRVAELLLVIREAPTRTALSWPKSGEETHSEGWLRAASGATETAALRKVWRADGDTAVLRTAGAELCKAIGDGSTQKALFWIQWILDEEARQKKATKGGGLTTIDRGNPGQGTARTRPGAGLFMVAVFGEIYKELAAKQLVRMHEEFQTLTELYKGGDAYLQGRAKKQILGLLAQILCEVPRWKVPAAPALIKDPVAMSQAIKQSPRFFKEVLAYDPPKNQLALVKAFKSKAAATDTKLLGKSAANDKTVEKMNAMEKVIEQYFMRA